MKKHSKQSLTQNTELRTFSIRIKSDKLEKKIKDILFTYKHFENMVLILINQNYNLYKEKWLKDKLFKLCNPIKIKGDYEFCRLLKSLWNSGSGKSVP